MIGAVLFIANALIVIAAIVAFVSFVIWGMVVPGRVHDEPDDRRLRRRA